MPESSRASPVTPAPCSSPSRNAPRPLTTRIPSGNGRAGGPARRRSSRKRRHAPAPLTSATPTHRSTAAVTSRGSPRTSALTAYGGRAARRRCCPGHRRRPAPRAPVHEHDASRVAASRRSSARRTARCRAVGRAVRSRRPPLHGAASSDASSAVPAMLTANVTHGQPCPLAGHSCSSAARARPPAVPPRKIAGRSRWPMARELARKSRIRDSPANPVREV